MGSSRARRQFAPVSGWPAGGPVDGAARTHWALWRDARLTRRMVDATRCSKETAPRRGRPLANGEDNKVVVRRLAFAIGLLCALIGSQLPEFAQQYRQRLGGALDELRRIIAQFDSEAEEQSLTRAQGVERLKGNADALARGRALALEEDVDRADRLGRQQEAFQTAGPVARLATLIENFDPTTATQAIRDFEPAVPVTIESFIVAGVALALGVSATHLVAWPIRRRLRRRSASHGRRLA